MALPVTITGLFTSLAPCGPFKSSSVPVTVVNTTSSGVVVTAFGSTTGSSQAGQSWTTDAAATPITQVMFGVVKNVTPSDALVCNIYAADGSGLPTGAALATSDTVLASTITTTLTYASFKFSPSFTPSPSTKYVAMMSRTGAANATNHYSLMGVSSSSYAGGNVVSKSISSGLYVNSASLEAVCVISGVGSNYYIFGRDSSDASMLRAYKATDPTSSWSSVATFTGNVDSKITLASSQVGTTIHLIMANWQSGSVGYSYTTFDMTTDLFGAHEQILARVATLGQTGADQSGCGIVVRSTGEAVVIFNGLQTKTSGTFYARAYYSRRTAPNTWSAAVQVDANTAGDNIARDVSLGLSDRLHFFWQAGTGNVHRALTSANALQTVSASFASSGRIGSGSYQKGAVVKVRAGIIQGGTSFTETYGFDSADVPTIVTLGRSSPAGTACSPARMFYDSGASLLWMLSCTATAVRVHKSSDDGVTLGAAVATAMSGTFNVNTNETLSRDALLYQRGPGIVAPYVVNDNGTLKYNEYALPIADAWNSGDKNTAVTLSDIDKTATLTSSTTAGVRSTQQRVMGAAGKYYVEFLANVRLNAGWTVGLQDGTLALASIANSATMANCNNGNINIAGNQIGYYIGAISAGDVIGLAWDSGAERVWFRRNSGDWNATAGHDPATGVGGQDCSALPNNSYALFFLSATNTDSCTIRTEVADLTYTVPSGFTSWMGELVPTSDGWNINDKGGSATFSNADKTCINSSGAGGARSTKGYLHGTDTGKYYVECVATFAAGALSVGFAPTTIAVQGVFTDAISIPALDGQVRYGTTILGAGVGAFGDGDVIGLAWDLQNKKVWARKANGIWNNNASADPSTNVGGYDVSAALSVNYCLWYTSNFTSHGSTIRTELADLGYTIPAGFKSWMGEASGPVDCLGTLNLTQGAQTVSAAGTVDPIDGDLVLPQAAQTLAAQTKVVVGGVLSVIEADDTLAANATVANPAVTGTLAITQGAQTLVATGGPVARGTLSVPQAAQTLVAQAGVTVGGTLSVTAANNTISAQAKVVVSGTFSQPQDAQTLTAAATVGFPVITGTLNVAQAAQTLVATGGPVVRGTLTAPQAAQTLSAQASVTVGGTLGVNQADNALAAAGNVPVAGIDGSLNQTQTNQTLAAIGTVSGTRPWVPTDLGSDLHGWFDGYDAATVTITGSGVSAWGNKGVRPFTLVQSADVNKPSYASNTVTFVTPQVLANTNPLAITIFDFLVVGAPSASNANWRTLLHNSDGHNLILTKSGTDIFGGYCEVPPYFYAGAGAAGMWASGVDGLAYGRIGPGEVFISRDGGLPVTTTIVQPSDKTTANYVGGYYNASGVGGDQGWGGIKELIFFPYNSSDNVRQRLEGYAAWKWGLNSLLPVDHPYKTSAPTTGGGVDGALFVTQANQSLTATGTVAIGGTLGIPQAAQTLTAQAGPVVRGTLTTPQANQALVAAGGPRVDGLLSVSQANQGLVATGSVGVGGTLTALQAAQTISAAGKVAIGGTLSQAQADNTLVAAGNVPVVGIGGSLSQTQANQTLASVGTVSLSGALSQPQASQTLAAQAGPIARGQLSAPQAGQTLVAAGGPVARGQLSAPQASQTLVAAGGAVVRGQLSTPQASQTLVAAGNVVFPVISGSLNQPQASQTLAAVGHTLVNGQLSTPQAAQTLSAAGKIIVTGVLSRTQANQTLVASGIIMGGMPKVWMGSEWVAKPAKVWMGSAWVKKPVKHWTGSEWRET